MTFVLCFQALLEEKEDFEKKLNTSLENEEQKTTDLLNSSQEKTNELENELKVMTI